MSSVFQLSAITPSKSESAAAAVSDPITRAEAAAPCDPSQEAEAWKWVWERDPHAVLVKHAVNLAEINYYMCISDNNSRHWVRTI